MYLFLIMFLVLIDDVALFDGSWWLCLLVRVAISLVGFINGADDAFDWTCCSLDFPTMILLTNCLFSWFSAQSLHPSCSLANSNKWTVPPVRLLHYFACPSSVYWNHFLNNFILGLESPLSEQKRLWSLLPVVVVVMMMMSKDEAKMSDNSAALTRKCKSSSSSSLAWATDWTSSSLSPPLPSNSSKQITQVSGGVARCACANFRPHSCLSYGVQSVLSGRRWPASCIYSHWRMAGVVECRAKARGSNHPGRGKLCAWLPACLCRPTVAKELPWVCREVTSRARNLHLENQPQPLQAPLPMTIIIIIIINSCLIFVGFQALADELRGGQIRRGRRHSCCLRSKSRACASQFGAGSRAPKADQRPPCSTGQTTRRIRCKKFDGSIRLLC